MSTLRSRPRQLILIRHAESARNKAKDGSVYFPDEESKQGVAGIGDHEIPLTELGHLQAQQAGIYLRQKYGVPDFIYDSNYLRTKQTKEGILKAFNPEEIAKIEQRSNIALRERDPGYTYDMTLAEVEKYFPYIPRHYDTFKSFFNRPIGGESLADVAEKRILPFLEKVYRDRDGQNVWFICHGGTIRCTRFNIEHWSPEEFTNNPGPHNCGITVYDQKMVPTMIDGRPSTRKKLILNVFDDISWVNNDPILSVSAH